MVWPIHRNIGIIGLAGTGKTCFLTALINHLRYHRPHKLPLTSPNARAADGSYGICNFTHAASACEFPYDQYRSKLGKDHTWPEKSSDIARYDCAFERSGFPFHRRHGVSLSLRDFPGERFSDAVIIDHDYDAWSEHIVNSILRTDTYEPLAREFLALLEQPDAAEAELVTAYKTAMARVYLAYLPPLSPSAFVLDRQGRQPAPEADAATLVCTRFSGLDAEREFAPIPPRLQARHAAACARFRAAYASYRKELVVPQFALLRECDALVVLVDVIGALMTGPHRYNADRKLLETVIRAARPCRKGSMRSFFSWHAVRRVAFVAPKLDLVCGADADALKDMLEAMLCDLIKDLRYTLDAGNVGAFVCSAIASTTQPKEPGCLCGYPIFVDGARAESPSNRRDPIVYGPVSRVPKGKPDSKDATSWDTEYNFPAVYPLVPACEEEPPEHINLHHILGFLLP